MAAGVVRPVADLEPLDAARIKADFPILARPAGGSRLVFLDSAASSQRPTAVGEAIDRYYAEDHANVHRAAYALAERATNAMESGRRRVASFVGGSSAEEIVFTKNATESLNLVARSWGAANLRPGDVVVLSLMEHHANIVPWLQLAESHGVELRWLGLTPEGRLDLSGIDEALDGASLLSITGMSNVLGTVPPVAELAERAHAAGALVCVDACQSAPHTITRVVDLGADFLAFSGHKLCGPTGVGVLWARTELLESMPPFLGGGGMILDVRTDGFTPAAVPHKFEAGTPPIAEIVGLAAAIDYLEDIGLDRIAAHEHMLTEYALETLPARFGDDLTIFGPANAEHRGGIVSFAFADIHPHDLSQVLDTHGVCVRPGHHCAKPLMRVLGVGATARASWYLYNDTDDIDALADALADARSFFAI